jgi:hypothetical protein
MKPEEMLQYSQEPITVPYHVSSEINVLMFGFKIQCADRKASIDTEQFKRIKDVDVHLFPNGIGAHDPAFIWQKTVSRYTALSL